MLQNVKWTEIKYLQVAVSSLSICLPKKRRNTVAVCKATDGSPLEESLV